MSDDYYRRVQEIIQREKATRPPPKPPRPRKLAPGQGKRFLRKSVAAFALAVALVYLGDFAIFHLRKDSVGQVTVRVYYAIGQKNGKTELAYQQPQQVSCANALFPRDGMSTCWWLRQHPEQRVDFFRK